MKFLGLLSKIGFCLTICAALASADSLQLRNGRRLQGKYIGGTSTAIGFMSGASVEYFATTDVLILMFDNASDSSLGGNQTPSPMGGTSEATGFGDSRRFNTTLQSTPTGSRRNLRKRAAVAYRSTAVSGKHPAACPSDGSQAGPCEIVRN